LFPIRVADEPTVNGWRSNIESLELEWRDDTSLRRPFTDYARANFHLVSSTAARLAHDQAVLDAVESIIGPDILCWMSELIIKEPHSSKVLTMHQDLTYWGLDGADHLVSAWVALSDATTENGAMRFVPGSHLAGQIEHRDTFGSDNLLSRGQEVVVDVDPDDEVPVELRAGEMSLHHGHMFHGSGPNRTDGRRIAMVFRFMSPSVRQTVGVEDYAMTVRGSNTSHHVHATAVPFNDFSSASLAMHARVTAAQERALTAGTADQVSYLR
jgi:ectoine hydroxylase-related dioxygenase (phytanoyl-CoA dioxygenase family)